MGAKKLKESSARTTAKGADETTRVGTAKDWRGKGSASSKKSKKKAAGALRVGTAKDWREAVAKKKTEKPASPAKKTEKMRGGLSRG